MKFNCKKCDKEVEIPDCDKPEDSSAKLYCAECFKEVVFEHNGYECEIIQRADLYYCYKVCGHNKSEDKIFYPELLFDKDLSLERIREASISMIDGTFQGKVEVYGNRIVLVD
jgi:hypothetical protein